LPAPVGVGGVIVQRDDRTAPRPIDALVFADQEGCAVRAFAELSPAPSARAVRSKAHAYRLLRRTLSFRGITITDSLSVVHGRAARWAPAAARAGADLLLFNDPRDATRARIARLRAAFD
jgi:beta-glucosidase-like glycosyl hydrolase